MSTAAVVDSLARDARQAVRGLRRSPLFTVVGLLTLAIGIGATTAVFSVVDGVLLKPLGYPKPDELVALKHDAPGLSGLGGGVGVIGVTPSMLIAYRELNRSFASLGLYYQTGTNVIAGSEPEQVSIDYVSGDLLATLGTPPLLGRWIAMDDEAPGRPPVVVLSYDYWQRRFGGDPSVVGKTLNLHSEPAEIVGVSPKNFRIAAFDPTLIGSLTIDRSNPSGAGWNGVARLKPGVTIEQANADVARMLPLWADMFPSLPGGGDARQLVLETYRVAPAIKPLKADVVGDVGNTLWLVLGTIVVVLAIACANVTNLLLVRGERRAQEIAVRTALGAGALHVSRALLIESVVLALGGAALGMALASGALPFLLRLAPQLPRLDTISLDARVLAATLAVTVVAGVLLGLAPALRASRGPITQALRAGGRGSSGSRERHRVQNALVVGQVALTLVLLVGSGLMLRTVAALHSVELGFDDPPTLQTTRIGLPPQLVPDPRAVLAQERAMLDAVAAIPGVESAAFASDLPLEDLGRSRAKLDVENQLMNTTTLRLFRFVSPGAFKTLGIPLVAGRDFDWADVDSGRPVAVVSKALARELWGAPENALGKRLRPGNDDGTGRGPWREVVGVADDVHDDSLLDSRPAVAYWPATLTDFWQPGLSSTNFIALVMRSKRSGTAAFARELERAVWSVNASVPLALTRTMQQRVDAELSRPSFALVMLGIAGVAGLVLGVVGLYGVLSYTVSQRRREIAILLALGAQQGAVTRKFVRQGLVLAAIGVAIGLGAAAGVTRLMTTLLYDVRPLDPLTYAAVTLVLAVAAVLASWIPARRAAAVDPAEALAAE
jgi:putative ABC transport system permease protein